VLECSTAPVRGEDEKVIGLIIVAHDVTEEHEINKARELITHTIIHDLKSPMGAITSALHLIDDVTSEQPTRDDVIDQSLDIAQRSSQKVISLAESLLDIAKMQSGEMKINREPADLNAMIRQLGVDFIPQARTLNVVINIELSNDIPIFDMDQSKISRVLTNLVDNALKFTPTGGEIKITAMLEMDSALVCVADNGPGVPEEYREKVFEQFTQVPGTRGRRRGSGLGLTFCRLTVEGHGGRIWVDSEDGNGSVFKFSLPITAPDLDEETHPTIK
jgi:signal transduction histidine kinase